MFHFDLELSRMTAMLLLNNEQILKSNMEDRARNLRMLCMKERAAYLSHVAGNTAAPYDAVNIADDTRCGRHLHLFTRILSSRRKQKKQQQVVAAVIAPTSPLTLAAPLPDDRMLEQLASYQRKLFNNQARRYNRQAHDQGRRLRERHSVPNEQTDSNGSETIQTDELSHSSDDLRSARSDDDDVCDSEPDSNVSCESIVLPDSNDVASILKRKRCHSDPPKSKRNVSWHTSVL